MDVIDRRMGARYVIPSRPAIELHHTRKGRFGPKVDTIDGMLVEVSVTGAMVVTSAALRDVEVGTVVALLLQGRKSTAIVRRMVVHHDMAFYGLEYRRIDDWLQALIDRVVTTERGELRPLL